MKYRHLVAYTTLLICGSLVISASTTAGQSGGSEALAARLQSGDRSDADKQRDAGRKPAAVITYLGIGAGQTVMDVLAASGYYTEVLSNAVGKSGKVYAQNTPGMLAFRDGANDKAMASRLAGNRLPNVQRLDKEFTNLGIEPGSLDVAITALNLHDIFNGSPQGAYDVLMAIKAALRPGGVLGVVDHVGNPGADNADLHRMTKAQAVSLAERAGFNVESSDVLANSEDDHTKMVFAPGLRGNTDRFVLKLTKP